MSKAERYTTTHAISWEELHRDCRELAHKLVDVAEWRGIIAITRGGLVPAAIVARELDIRLIDTICVLSYAWQDQGDAKIIKRVEGDGEGFLLLDDLVDTGRTARLAKKFLPKAHFAVVYAKPQGLPLVDIHVKDFSQDTWVLFPWDSESQFVKPIVARGDT